MITFAVRRVLGLLCVFFGLFALFTPLTPGAWLILVGLELLGLHFLIPKPLRKYWIDFKAELHVWWKKTALGRFFTREKVRMD